MVKVHGVGKLSFVMCVVGILVAVLTVGPFNVGLFWGLNEIPESHVRYVVALAIPAAWTIGVWSLWMTATGRAWLAKHSHRRRGFVFGFLIGAMGPIVVLVAAIYMMLTGQ